MTASHTHCRGCRLDGSGHQRRAVPTEMTSSATLDIAEYVVGMQFSDIPELAVSRAKTAILDTIGVTLAGSRLATGRMMMDYVEGTGATGVATVFASNQKSSPELAALANGLLAHVLDYDDRGHVSTHTLPAALALGERDDVSGEELLVAYIVGREVRQHIDEEFRPGRKSKDGSTEKGSGPGWRGWHETGVVGAMGATAAAARVTRLATDKTVMAIGIAASLASGLMANFGTSTKSLHAGNAARNGVLATTLAAEGFTADPNILTTRRGYVEALSYPETRDMTKVAAGLRSYFHLVDKGIRIKPYPACTGTHQFIETMRYLCRRTRPAADGRRVHHRQQNLRADDETRLPDHRVGVQVQPGIPGDRDPHRRTGHPGQLHAGVPRPARCPKPFGSDDLRGQCVGLHPGRHEQGRDLRVSVAARARSPGPRRVTDQVLRMR